MSLFKGGSVVFTVHEADNGYVAEITQSGRPLVVIGKTLSECVEAAQAAAASVRVTGKKKTPPPDEEEDADEDDDEDIAADSLLGRLLGADEEDRVLKAWEDGDRETEIFVDAKGKASRRPYKGKR